jgi:hypothetical protein
MLCRAQNPLRASAAARRAAAAPRLPVRIAARRGVSAAASARAGEEAQVGFGRRGVRGGARTRARVAGAAGALPRPARGRGAQRRRRDVRRSRGPAAGRRGRRAIGAHGRRASAAQRSAAQRSAPRRAGLHGALPPPCPAAAAAAAAADAPAAPARAPQIAKLLALPAAAGTLLAAGHAQAATELAQLAAGDGRLGTISLLFLPAIGWVAFNILGPLNNQLNRMSELNSEGAAPKKRRGVAGAVGLGAALSLAAAQQADAATEMAQLAASDGR